MNRKIMSANVINPEKRIMFNGVLSPDAEEWAKELYEELVIRFGYSPEEALGRLTVSPFFKKEWVCYQGQDRQH